MSEARVTVADRRGVTRRVPPDRDSRSVGPPDAPRETQPVSALVTAHTRRLAEAGVASPAVDARTLARYALELDPAGLATATTGDVAPDQLDRLDGLVERRVGRVPVQLLVGETGFRHLRLACRPGVFIPRPETEVLAGAAIAAARTVVDRGTEVRVVEPCTGTGAVALAIAAEVDAARIVATDVSAEAVALARHNLARLAVTGGTGNRETGDGGTGSYGPGRPVGPDRADRIADPRRVSILAGDLLDPVDVGWWGTVDVLVANPPYLTRAEFAASHPEVADHDPPAALVADERGFAMIDRLLAAGRTWLADDGRLLVEITETRAEETVQYARDAGYDDIRLIDDLTGRPRVLSAGRPS